jgi:hypothetical protein
MAIGQPLVHHDHWHGAANVSPVEKSTLAQRQPQR